jgi:hypothetical protein
MHLPHDALRQFRRLPRMEKLVRAAREDRRDLERLEQRVHDPLRVRISPLDHGADAPVLLRQLTLAGG